MYLATLQQGKRRADRRVLGAQVAVEAGQTIEDVFARQLDGEEELEALEVVKAGIQAFEENQHNDSNNNLNITTSHRTHQHCSLRKLSWIIWACIFRPSPRHLLRSETLHRSFNKQRCRAICRA